VTADAGARAPYAGLRHYTEADAAFFFGREAERDIVIANLLASRLTLVYGESGVGKSSLLHAGVARRLRALSEELAAGDEPGLAVVVFAEWSAADPVRALIARAASEVDRLAPGPPLPADVDLASALTALSDRLGGDLLIVLDQFEESFLYQGDSGPGTIGVELPRALRRDDGANFIVSIREDQLAQLDRFKGQIPNLFDNYIRVQHLDRAAARAAIVRPLEELTRLEGAEAEPFGAEEQLVERVLEELAAGKVVVGSRGAGTVEGGGEPGAGRIETPYLQLVLNRLWEEERRADSRTLRTATLESLGGGEAIVRSHLDDALSALSPGEQAATSRLFHYLVTPSGTKIAHHRADLAAYAGLAESESARLLERLAGETRILRPVGEESYEIYHDVLASAVLDWRARAEERMRDELRARSRARRRRLFVAASVASVALWVVGYSQGLLDESERRAVDARFSIRGDRTAEDVAVVGIDDTTFDDLRLNWPFNRLRQDGARAIAYDIQFTEQSPGREGAREDNALVEAVARAGGRIVLATTEVGGRGSTTVLGGDTALRELGARAGNALSAVDPDGVVRRMVHSLDGLETFPLVAAEVASGSRIAPSRLSGRATWIDFAGPPGSIPTASFSRVLDGSFPAGTFRGKVVVVGATAPSLQDVSATATGGLMSGPELQANAIQTALDSFPLRSAPAPIGIISIVLLGLLAPVLSFRLRPLLAFGVTLAVGALYLVGAQVAFQGGIVLLVLYPLVILVVTAVAALAVDVAGR
jgi:CHASE2 domain-containing sensor protein